MSVIIDPLLCKPAAARLSNFKEWLLIIVSGPLPLLINSLGVAH